MGRKGQAILPTTPAGLWYSQPSFGVLIYFSISSELLSEYQETARHRFTALGLKWGGSHAIKQPMKRNCQRYNAEGVGEWRAYSMFFISYLALLQKADEQLRLGTNCTQVYHHTCQTASWVYRAEARGPWEGRHKDGLAVCLNALLCTTRRPFCNFT